jgi:hypothetical protein
MGIGLSEEDVWATKNAGSEQKTSNTWAARSETETRDHWRASFITESFTTHPTSPLHSLEPLCVTTRKSRKVTEVIAGGKA